MEVRLTCSVLGPRHNANRAVVEYVANSLHQCREGVLCDPQWLPGVLTPSDGNCLLHAALSSAKDGTPLATECNRLLRNPDTTALLTTSLTSTRLRAPVPKQLRLCLSEFYQQVAKTAKTPPPLNVDATVTHQEWACRVLQQSYASWENTCDAQGSNLKLHEKISNRAKRVALDPTLKADLMQLAKLPGQENFGWLDVHDYQVLMFLMRYGQRAPTGNSYLAEAVCYKQQPPVLQTLWVLEEGVNTKPATVTMYPSDWHVRALRKIQHTQHTHTRKRAKGVYVDPYKVFQLTDLTCVSHTDMQHQTVPELLEEIGRVMYNTDNHLLIICREKQTHFYPVFDSCKA